MLFLVLSRLSFFWSGKQLSRVRAFYFYALFFGHFSCFFNVASIVPGKKPYNMTFIQDGAAFDSAILRANFS